jgi:hypothetical protein
MMIRQGDLRAISLIFLAVVLVGVTITLGVGYATLHKAQAQIQSSSSSSLVTTDNYVVENSLTDGDDMVVRSQTTGRELKLHCLGSISPDENGDARHYSNCYELPVGEVIPLEKWDDTKYVRKKTSVHGEDDYESR